MKPRDLMDVADIFDAMMGRAAVSSALMGVE